MSEIFQVTARKWRPMRFDDVVGQDHVTRTLKNAIREGRLAHAYLFTGQRGCGKTTVARVLAKAINCPNAKENDYEPCNKCGVCTEITEGRSMDVSEIDGASNNGVDDVRSLRDNVKYPPLHGDYKVVIIDEVHMLSTSAFNALLKTLEEPPRHLVFIFATTEVQKVLPTILSRTQRYDFRRMQLDEIITRLRLIADTDGIKIDDEALLIVAKKGDGSMRDSQSIFDQVVAFCGKNVDTQRVREALNLIDTDFFFEVSDAILERNAAKAFELSQAISSRGYDIEEFFIGLLEHFRNLLTARLTKKSSLIEVSKLHQERYLNVSSELSEGDLLRLVRLGQNALEALKTSQQPRIILEVALVEMMMMERAMELSQLMAAINGNRSGLSSSSGGVAEATKPRASSHVVNRIAEAPKERLMREVVQPPVAQAIEEKTISKPEVRQEPVSKAKVEPVVSASSSDQSFDADEVMQRWSEFAQFVKTKSRIVGVVMEDVQPCGLRRNTIYLAAELRDTLEVLKQYQTQFNGYLREFFGKTQLMFEVGPHDTMAAKAEVPLVNVSLPSTASAMSSENSGDAPRQMRSAADLSEMEKAIVEKFRAHPVD
jgi:DNA polymerase-3 subunit gamma/tau